MEKQILFVIIEIHAAFITLYNPANTFQTKPMRRRLFFGSYQLMVMCSKRICTAGIYHSNNGKREYVLFDVHSVQSGHDRFWMQTLKHYLKYCKNSSKISIREMAQDTAADIRMESDMFFLTLTLITGKNYVQHMVVANTGAFCQI